MKWFKHNSKSSKNLMESEILFRSQGPYVYWRLMEILSYEDATEKPLRINFEALKLWFPSVTKSKFEKILIFFRDKNEIILNYFDKEIEIFCYELSTKSNSYNKKLGKNSKKLPSLDLENKIKIKNKKTIKEKQDWKTDFKTYQVIVKKAYSDLLNDSKKITQQEEFYSGVDIKLSLKRAYTNFWGVEAGWKYCVKKRRGEKLDMHRCLINAIDKNKVWKPKQTFLDRMVDDGPNELAL